MTKLDKAINKSIEYLLSHREKDGMWLNFLSRTHGESTDWVSSYVGLNLIKSDIEKSELVQTAQSILKRQRENGGFSYNEKIVPDADSTAFAILFLSNLGYDKELKKAREFLEIHQNLDGSFSTYRPELIRKYYRITDDMSVEGWCSGTNEVTASAFQALPNKDKALNYLKENQQREGFWRAYWWNDNIYPTVYAIFSIKDFDLEEEISRAQRWLAQRVSDLFIPFYIALSLQGLIINRRYDTIIESGIKKLLDSQQEDGSWKTYPILRFPYPSNTKPWVDSSRWREDSKDQNRIFTTATCLKTLVDYKKRQ